MSKNFNCATEMDVKGGLIGKKLGNIYGGYFINSANTNFLVKTVLDLYKYWPKNKIIKILEIGAGTGMVGRQIREKLVKNGFIVSLVISDIVKKGLYIPQNKGIKKAVFDNKDIPFEPHSFDLIVARSVTHYEEDLKKERIALKEIRRVLKKDGYFVSQVPTMSNRREVLLLKNIYLLISKKMNLQTKTETKKMLNSIFSKVVVSPEKPAMLKSEMSDFFKRYNLEKRLSIDLINEIQSIISKVSKKIRPNFEISGRGFYWQVPYKIFICKN